MPVKSIFVLTQQEVREALIDYIDHFDLSPLRIPHDAVMEAQIAPSKDSSPLISVSFVWPRP